MSNDYEKDITEALGDNRHLILLGCRADADIDHWKALAANPKFTADLPSEEHLWWWWNGDEDAAPVHVEIMYSGSNGEHFASLGQHGWTVAQWVKDMGGMWAKATVPATPIT
jgi:hypothetical protein